MKRITLLWITAFWVLTSLGARAQEYTYTLGNSAQKAIEFTVAGSDVHIEGYDGDKVVIRNLDYEAPPERAKGLKPLYNSAEDNTGIGLSVQDDNGTLKIITTSRNNGEYSLKVPNKIRVMLEEMNWGGGDFELHNLQGEIEIKSKNADMKLVNVTGPVIASSTSGDMEITMSSLSQAGPTSISLISGFIDLSIPADSKAKLNMSSISGEIYSNLDVQVKGEPKDNMRRLGGRKVEGTLNGGGVEVNLKTISGNIYLRKKK